MTILPRDNYFNLFNCLKDKHKSGSFESIFQLFSIVQNWKFSNFCLKMQFSGYSIAILLRRFLFYPLQHFPVGSLAIIQFVLLELKFSNNRDYNGKLYVFHQNFAYTEMNNLKENKKMMLLLQKQPPKNSPI